MRSRLNYRLFSEVLTKVLWRIPLMPAANIFNVSQRKFYLIRLVEKGLNDNLKYAIQEIFMKFRSMKVKKTLLKNRTTIKSISASLE